MNRREQVAAALRNVKSLPTLPDVAVRLLESSDDASSSTREMAALVERDISMASRLLKLVNSPFFGMRREVTSVQHALLIVGVSNLRSLVLSSAVLDLFDHEGSVGSFRRKDFWTHCLGVAAAARVLAEKTQVCERDLAFTAGLLHDMGKVVVDRYLHPEFEQIMERLDADDAMAMLDAEAEIIGVTHASLGEHLCVLWNLPEVLQESVGYHHRPTSAPTHASVAAIVGLADRIVRQMGVGKGGGADPMLEPEVMELCRLDHKRYLTILSGLQDSLHEQISSFVGDD